MPIYEFICNCGNSEEIFRKISEGPPSFYQCKCGQKMTMEYSANFILKGDGWPGKDLKKNDYESGKTREETEQKLNEDISLKRNANEVLKARRQGKQAFKKFQKENPGKIKDYQKGMKRGIRGKDGRKKG